MELKRKISFDTVSHIRNGRESLKHNFSFFLGTFLSSLKWRCSLVFLFLALYWGFLSMGWTLWYKQPDWTQRVYLQSWTTPPPPLHSSISPGPDSSVSSKSILCMSLKIQVLESLKLKYFVENLFLLFNLFVLPSTVELDFFFKRLCHWYQSEAVEINVAFYCQMLATNDRVCIDIA